MDARVKPAHDEESKASVMGINPSTGRPGVRRDDAERFIRYVA
jgi:hypothetical protein